MDAERSMELLRVKSFPRLAGFLCVVTLAGCAGSGGLSNSYRDGIVARLKAERSAMATRVLAQPLPLNTVIKTGPHGAMAQFDVPAQGAEPATQARLFARCDTQALSMDYRDARAWTIVSALPEQTPATRSVTAQLCQAAKGGEWRALAANEADWLLLDPQSQAVIDGQLWVWTGVDYERARQSEDDTYTYDRQYERVEIDCAARQVNSRLSMRSVAATLLTPPTQPIASSLSANQRSQLVGALCPVTADLANLPAAIMRKKLPPNLATPQVPETLLSQARALPRGEAASSLSHLQMVYSASSPLIPGAQINENPLDLYLQTGPAPGLWRVQSVGALSSEGVSIRWRGLIDLATINRIGNSGKMEQRPSPESIHLAGDWKNVPGGATLSYSKVSKSSEGKAFTQNVECQVGPSFPASQQVASLKGEARLVTCAQLEGLKSKSTHVYLKDYDLFVQTLDSSMLIVQNNTLKAAE